MADETIRLLVGKSFYGVKNPQQLVVLLHRFRATPLNLQRVAEVVRESYPQSDIYAPELPVSLFSCADPEAMAQTVVRYISALPRIDSYTSIILVGHSLGAVLTRKIWALAHGAMPDATVRPDRACTWAGKIDRIVLLAAFSRGWSISSALQPGERLGWTLGTACGNFLRYVVGKDPVIFGFRRGASFLTVARLQSLAVDATLTKRPITVQLIGTDDDFIAPTDNLDLATGENFYYLEVNGATHHGIVELKPGPDDVGPLPQFRLALNGDENLLRQKSQTPDDVFEGCDEVNNFGNSILPEPNLKVTRVVFVIHGIRDRGFWTRRIARKIKSVARQNDKDDVCRSVTSTYGYFPMGPFLLPWVRRDKVEWLLDQYVEAKSIYPRARFSYVGHSNGTYLLAKALEICLALRFEDGVVFCGSMVRTSFDWSEYIPSRISRMVNYVATADWVVAIFPGGLERLHWQDVGAAGHLGFKTPENANVRYVKGEHSAALVPGKWQEMAEFVLYGASPPHIILVSQDPGVLRRGRWSPAILIGLLAFVIGIAVSILAAIGCLAGWVGPCLALVFALYLYLLRVFLTRA